jgi:hypothetical protein
VPDVYFICTKVLILKCATRSPQEMRFDEHAVGTEPSGCLSAFSLARRRTARAALMFVGPRDAEDLSPKPRNSLVKRFHGQHEVGGDVRPVLTSDLTAESS